MSPPKRKRSGRELKSRSLNDLSGPMISDVVSSERASEDPASAIFHKCPIEPDSEMKRVEDDAEVPHSGKPESETVTGGLPEKIPEDPPLEKEDPKGLSFTVMFQQKLFGSRLGRFMVSTTNYSVVIPIPIPPDTTTGNKEPVETESVDMEVSIPNPPPSTGSIVITGKEATIPTLVTLAASFPRFQHPFAVTSIPKSPFQTGVAFDEEALDKARSCLMDGMHLLNEVSRRARARTEQLSQRQIVFEEALEGLKRLQTLHEQTEEEAKGLREEVAGLSGRNQNLVRDLNQAIYQQGELKKLNQDLQLKLDDVVSRRVSAVKKLEGISQQYHSLKS
ncbi:unnamed protein product [Lactuca virosa]|uniref:Uncharacterized protein n=1 Tax=Lactuca virosa TaxID=75947 RepID=A0AAU9NK98_9ASTR|nr:unnamed protein product [Lactuca virosa]